MTRIMLMAAMFVGLFSTRILAEPLPKSESNDTVYVIPVRGMIEPALVYVIRRGLAEAASQDARAVVFVMDTPGGTLNAASEIVRTIQRVDVPTYTFVEKDAFSAGAIIALATDQIYMAPGSVIGDAMPIMMSPMGGGPQEMPDDVQEKMVSGVAALIRSAAQESGHDPALAEKMVRRDGEYRIGDDVIAPTNRLLTLTNIEAERMVTREGMGTAPLLSAGTVKGVPELLAKVGLEGTVTRQMEVTQSEKLARFIAALAPFFLMAGLLGIYVEIKTPGLGIPGILGGLSLAIFFWGHHIAGLAGMEEVALFVVGVLLIVAELFFLPTMGFLGVAGAGLMLWALLLSMIQHLPGSPVLPPLPELQVPIAKLSASIVMSAVASLLLGRILPHTPAFRHLALETATSVDRGYRAVATPPIREGDVGQTLSSLRPAGSARFGDRRIDVITRGEFVDTDRAVRVVGIRAGSAIVEEVRT